MAIVALGAGIGASILAITGVVIVFSGLNTLSHDLNNVVVTPAAAAAHATQVAAIQEDRLIHQDLFIGNA
jgi:hypothetical protein